jgi:hypothetical protein
MSDVFCTTPYSMIMINPDGSYRICCLTNSIKHDMGAAVDPVTGAEMSVWTHTFAEAMNSKWHIEMRQAHQEGRRTEQCMCCYDRDDIKGDSRRKYVTKELGALIPEFVQEHQVKFVMLDDFRLKIPPVSLDLRFGNLCNLKCYMCGPWYSDKWYDEWQEFHNVDKFNWNGKLIKISNETRGKLGANANNEVWWESQVWWDRFDEIAPSLRHLYITGGEPMIVPAHDEILQKLVDKGLAGKVVIEIDTNLTALNPKIIALWKQFKRVDLRISLDAVGELYEIARFPAKWPRFVANVQKIKAVDAPNIRIWLTSCLSPLTVFQLEETEQFSKDMGMESNPHYRYIEGPKQLAIQYLTHKQKQFVVDYYTANPSRYSPNLIEYLRLHWDDCDVHWQQKFVEYMDFLDKSRSTDWRKLSPLTAQLYDPALWKE